MGVTLNDIARKAGVSVSTVSRILNGKSAQYRIAQETEELVRQTAHKLKYRPNQFAVGLRVSKSHSIGLVLPDVSNPFFAYITRSIQIAAHACGYSLMVCDTNEDLALEVEHIGLLRSKGVDGMIVLPVGQESSHISELVRDDVPIVLVDRAFGDLPIDSVIVDNYHGAFEAVEHLIRFGHSRIAMIQGLPNTYTNTGRRRGYVDALIKHGLSVDESLIVGKDFRKENGYIETKLLLQMNDRPTAIFSTSDLITLGALQAISEEGLKIPDDISLVAFDDMDFAPFLTCALTAVAQPKEHMGEIAVKLLVERMRKHEKREARSIVLTPKLVERDSVRKLVVAGAIKAQPV